MKSICVDIDSIFDTRLPVLVGISESIAEEVVLSEQYFNRVKDEFGTISADIFSVIYKTRNKNVLKFAGITKIPDVIIKIYTDRITDIKNCDIRNDIKIYINTYPYDFSSSEQEELRKAFMVNIAPCDYVFFKSNNLQLTPKWVLEKGIDTMIKYDLLEWIEIHMRNGGFDKDSLANTSLACPPILDKYAPSSKITIDAYKALKESFQAYANIEFLDMRYFCKVFKLPKTSDEEKE